MRSKIFQQVLDDIEKKSWFYRFKLAFKLELYVIKCLGVSKYISLNITKKIKKYVGLLRKQK